MKDNEDIFEIDLLKIFQALWRKAWLIVLITVLCGASAFGITKYAITPQYEARVLMYVNSTNISLGGTKLSISQGDLMAAQSLIDTYTVIMKTRTTLNEVIEEAELKYSYETLVNKISAASVNSTEVFQINVLDPDPATAALIANTIARVLPDKIASIVEGSSTRIVDTAVVPARAASPNIVKNVVIGVLLGAILSCGAIVVMELMDDKIQDSDYLLHTYDIPVLAMIPDLLSTPKNSYGYYRRTEKSEVLDDD